MKIKKKVYTRIIVTVSAVIIAAAAVFFVKMIPGKTIVSDIEPQPSEVDLEIEEIPDTVDSAEMIIIEDSENNIDEKTATLKIEESIDTEVLLENEEDNIPVKITEQIETAERFVVQTETPGKTRDDYLRELRALLYSSRNMADDIFIGSRQGSHSSSHTIPEKKTEIVDAAEDPPAVKPDQLAEIVVLDETSDSDSEDDENIEIEQPVIKPEQITLADEESDEFVPDDAALSDQQSDTVMDSSEPEDEIIEIAEGTVPPVKDIIQPIEKISESEEIIPDSEPAIVQDGGFTEVIPVLDAEDTAEPEQENSVPFVGIVQRPEEDVVEKREEEEIPVLQKEAELSERPPRPSRDKTPEPEKPVVQIPADLPVPHLSIEFPETKTFYGKKIIIEGIVSNSDQDTSSVSYIGSASWEIPGFGEPEDLIFGSDGRFFINYSAAEISGKIEIIFRVENKEGDKKEERIVLFDGNSEPEVEIVSPLEDGAFGAVVMVTGTVSDSSAADLNLSGPESVSYSIFSAENSENNQNGEVVIKRNNSFSFLLDTSLLQGDQLLSISAVGRNGKTTEKTIRLIKSDSDIPGYRLESVSKKLVIAWNPLPGVDSFSLRYTEGENDPLKSKVRPLRNVTSPVVLNNLEVGKLYSFQLQADVKEGGGNEAKTYYSEVVQGIMLKDSTLKPVTINGYEQITLAWLNIPGMNRFDIFRSPKENGPYSLIRKNHEGATFVDKTVYFGQDYFYKIRPSLETALLSSSVKAVSLALPENKSVIVSDYVLKGVQDIDAAGSYLYLADSTVGLRLIDNSDSDNLIEVSAFLTTDAKSVIVQGDRAYIADGEKGIKIVDIYDPRFPELLGSRKTTNALKLVKNGDVLYIADGKAGIKVIDISSERKPARIAAYRSDNAVDLFFLDSYLYVADGFGGLKIFDASDSRRLKEISSFECGNALSVFHENNVVYLVDSGFGVRVIDVSDKWNPKQLSQIISKTAVDVTVSDNYLYIVDRKDGLNVFNITDLKRPVLFDTVKVKGAASVKYSEGNVFISTAKGFKTVKSFTTGRSYIISEYISDGKSYDLSYVNNTLYLADHQDGIKIIDASNPSDSSSFQLKGSLDTQYAESIVSFGSRLLIADGKGGIVVGDIQVNKNGVQTIEIVNEIELPGITKSVVMYGDSAYISAREEGMHILDIDTREITTVYTGGSVQEIAVSSEAIFVADGAAGLKIYANNLENPELLYTFPMENASSVNLSNNHIIVGGKGGMTLLDISDLQNPQVLSSYKCNWVEDIFVQSGFIYLAAGYEGLIVLDMKDPAQLTLVSSCADVYAVGVEVDKDLAFVADVNGFKVVKILIPSWLQ